MKLDHLKDINRLVIYFFYDADGVVDRYVPYMLEDVKKNCSELFVVCNGKLTPVGRETLSGIADHLMVRENVGFDVWAYKSSLDHYGWKKLSEYDEVVLMNFTFYGPLYPFSEMFKEMNSRDVDFWGITKHHGFHFDPFGTIPCGYIPEHIQSSFICVRSKMLNSIEFHDYWDNMGPVNSYGDAVGKHEAIFTKTFTDYGYVSDVYVQTNDLKEYTHYPLMLQPVELIANRKCPVFKRKSFTNEYYEFMNASLGEPTVELYEYIKNNFDYDMDMVWENLLRTDHMADIKNRMHLNYVMPRDYCENSCASHNQKTALFMHIYYEDEAEKCINYAKSMPENADIYITVCTRNMRDIITELQEKLAPRKVSILDIENRGRDVSALLVSAAPYIFNYDLVCFVHDKKTKQNEPYTVGLSWSYKCFENLLGSKEYVENIIHRFTKEPRLGMIMPPPPNHAQFYGIIGTEWGSNYNNTVKLLKDLKIDVKMSELKEPITPLGTMFWFRPNALKPLYNTTWKYEDFPEEPNGYDGTLLHAIERAYGFVSQSQGYYNAWCMHDSFAAIELTNYHFMLREISMSLYARLGNHISLCGMVDAIYKWSDRQSARKVIKEAIKRRVPKPIWNVCVKVYHLFGGKKWLG